MLLSLDALREEEEEEEEELMEPFQSSTTMPACTQWRDEHDERPLFTV